jgi:hypothetical protein
MERNMPEQQSTGLKKVVVILAITFCVAFIINLIVLKLVGQKSFYRAEHSLVGIILLLGFFYSLADSQTSRLNTGTLFLFALLPCYLGTVVPDLDIRLLGIGWHRNPLFHSGLPFFAILFLVRRRRSVLLAAVAAGFGVGLASHLLWDLYDHADVRWIPGGTLDRLWVGLNGLLCLVLARTFLGSRLQRS